MIRKIYMVEAFTDDGWLIFRRYAANKKTAECIAKPYYDNKLITVYIRLIDKEREWLWIDQRDVERI